MTTGEFKVVVNKKVMQSNANKCPFKLKNEANKALISINETRVESSRLLIYDYLSNSKQVETSTADTRTIMGVNNTPIPEGRWRSRLNLPKVGSSGSELSVLDGAVPGKGTTTEKRKLKGQETKQCRSYPLGSFIALKIFL